jgi:hypothetical protein
VYKQLGEKQLFHAQEQAVSAKRPSILGADGGCQKAKPSRLGRRTPPILFIQLKLKPQIKKKKKKKKGGGEALKIPQIYSLKDQCS